MNPPTDTAAQEREHIRNRLARFKATQERFRREREEYFSTTLQHALETNPNPH